MRSRRVRFIAVAVATAALATMTLLGAGTAAADEQTVMDEVPLTATNWSDTLSVPQFDPADGILQSVEVAFDATVQGDASYESLDLAPATITIELKAEVELQRPDTSTLSLLAPLVTQTDSAEAFDGDIDFDGPSGGTFEGLSGSLADMQLLTSPADLALFTGTGTVDFPVSATGMSTGSGAGNLLLLFNTNAAAKVTITYTFAAPAIDIEKATNGEDADSPTGPTIAVGDPVNWTYEVTNAGDVDLVDVVVTDDQGVAVSCPQTTLEVDESMTCTATGTAQLGQYANVGMVTGQGVDDAGAPIGEPVSDEDPSHYIGEVPAEPAIDIEKATNGHDADAPPGPSIPVGDPVTWTYVVTNTGNVDLTNVVVTDDQGVAVSCPQDTLAVDESMTCTANGVAQVGQYANLGTVTGDSVAGPVSDEDPSHYFGLGEPGIDIEKSTNGEDADAPTGPFILVGDPVTWNYEVTNTGDLPLTNVVVTDDQGAAVSCPQDMLAVGESMTCMADGTAEAGQYANVGMVTAESPGGPVDDEDPSHYFGAEPAIDIEKATNGEDADAPTGPVIVVGAPVTWTYEVTNTGNVRLTGVMVSDDQLGPITCPHDALDPGESMTCTASGTAQLGQYENVGSVVGEPVDDAGQPIDGPVEDEDLSHYLGVRAEGCTPGYWKQPQHFGSWVGFSPNDSYADVFGVPYDKTLLQALQTGGGGEKALGRHSVAALLNSANDDVNFFFDAAAVISLVQEAWATGDFNGIKNQLAAENEQGCDLGRNPGPDGGSGQGKGKGKGQGGKGGGKGKTR